MTSCKINKLKHEILGLRNTPLEELEVWLLLESDAVPAPKTENGDGAENGDGDGDNDMDGNMVSGDGDAMGDVSQ